MDLHIDLECFSEISLDLGPRKYAEGAEILVYGYAIGYEPPQVWFPTLDPTPPDDLLLALFAADRVFAHNHLFERAVTDRLHPLLGLPCVPVEKWRDTLQWCAYNALPVSLDAAAKVLRCDVQKDARGKALVRKFCLPQRPTKKRPTTRIRPEDDLDDLYNLGIYCATDVAVMREIKDILEPFAPKEYELAVLDSEMNRLGIPVDVATARKTGKMLLILEQRMTARFQEITGGLNPTQTGELTAWASTRCGIPNLQAGTIDAFLQDPGLAPEVREALTIRRSASKSSTKKLAVMSAASRADNTVADCFRLYGASTGRWTAVGLQPHNLVKPTLRKEDTLNAYKLLEAGVLEDLEMCFDPMEAVSSCMRHFIRAPEGEELFVGDYASIEARVICWLAGQEDALELYRQHADPYISMAARITGIDAAVIAAGYARKDPKAIEMRQLGKAVVLGCGFGMGWLKFVQTCANPPYNLALDDETAKRAVATYRKTYDRVPEFWKTCETMAIAAVSTLGWQTHHVAPGATLKMRVVENKSFKVLKVKLPSGRFLSYPFPEINPRQTPWGESLLSLTFMETEGTTRQWVRGDTYGGKIAENITQAVARDLMASGMVKARRKGFHVFMTVHDEVCAKARKGLFTFEQFLECLTARDEWSATVPVAAEGYRGEFYRK
jgi:DNA polymerase